ncbi:MAG TPA: alkaline phosphatase D family protein [Thermoanaerobaculia bacterium]|nr:alkaline phosphatase D family protein [Thermoanaerobaculia bacterium]
MIWVRTVEATTVRVEYGAPGSPWGESPAVTTTPDDDYTALLPIEGLIPSTTYEYRVVTGGQPGPLHRFTTSPPAGADAPVKIAVFADSFGGKSAPSFSTVAAMAPDLAMIIGDYDHRNPTTLTAIRKMHRELRGCETPLGCDFAASIVAREIPLYQTWDDHDYCNNNSTMRCPSRALAMRSWREYHAFSQDNGYPSGIWQRIVYGVVELFILDTRSNRNPDWCAGCRSMLGSEQQAWLKSRLASSTAIWKVIVTSVPFNRTVFKDADTWTGYAASRADIVAFIRDNDIRNVVLISGDIHSGGAIDDGTNSDFPELSVPLMNEGFANTGASSSRWSVGMWPQYTPGYGWIEASGTSMTLSAHGADGQPRVEYTFLAR